MHNDSKKNHNIKYGNHTVAHTNFSLPLSLRKQIKPVIHNGDIAIDFGCFAEDISIEHHSRGLLSNLPLHLVLLQSITVPAAPGETIV